MNVHEWSKPPVRIALDREEHEPCQAGTPGCCVDHDGANDESCQPW